MPDGKIKGFVEERYVPCSSEANYKNLRFGSEVMVNYLPSAPEKSNIEGNTLIWWLYLVKALAATMSLVGFFIFLKIVSPLEQKFSPKNIVIGTIALGIASANSMIVLVGLEYMAGVFIMGLISGIAAPFFIVGRWINYRSYLFMQDKLNARSKKKA